MNSSKLFLTNFFDKNIPDNVKREIEKREKTSLENVINTLSVLPMFKAESSEDYNNLAIDFSNHLAYLEMAVENIHHLMNKAKTQIRRRKICKIFSGAAFVLLVMIYFLSNPVYAKSSEADNILTYMNKARQEAGLVPYVLDTSLDEASTIRARECAISFSHTRPDGQPWYTVSDAVMGENLAHAANNTQASAENVVKAWLLSPTHKDNVLRTTFTSVNVKYFYAENGEIYIACEFK